MADTQTKKQLLRAVNSCLSFEELMEVVDKQLCNITTDPNLLSLLPSPKKLKDKKEQVMNQIDSFSSEDELIVNEAYQKKLNESKHTLQIFIHNL